MPSTYAHFKFAKEVLHFMPPKAITAVKDNPMLYFTGCHGPDILFYYKAIKSNGVNRLGYAMHERSAAPFFERTKELVKKGGQPSLAYTMGFITHFALDSTCHGYVESRRKAAGISHTKLEVEFDRSLLEADGKNAVKQRLCGHISPRKTIAQVIAPFFDLTPREIERSMRDMRTICNLFVCPNAVKRGIVRGVLKAVGGELPDQVMTKLPDPACAESNAAMKELYDEALGTAKLLAEDYMNTLGGGELCARFNRNYE